MEQDRIPLEHVVVGSSLGPESDQVVHVALSLARAAGARLSPVYALEPPPAAVPAGLLGFALVREGLASAAREELAAQLRRLGAGSGEVGELCVETMPAYAALRAVAERLPAGLVVVGAAAEPLPLRRVGGTVRRLLREELRPVLIVKGALHLPVAEVLAPVDLSLHAADSLRRGLALLGSCAASSPVELVALHVRRDGSNERDAERELEAFLAAHLADHRGAVRARVLGGDPAESILDCAAGERVELILIGTHGRSGWRRWTLGSVAEAVVRGAAASVLVVPPAAALAGAIADAVLEQTVGRRP
jgi:nucleotide-binding universal stress UspA family protein